jgi:hypothetical protein
VKPPLRSASPDDFQTPPHGVAPLLPFLEKTWTIWEPAAGKGNITRYLRAHGLSVVSSDIKNGSAFSFLTYRPREFDCIVTNPPFSLKNEFLERAYALGKPFAFLLPLTTLESRRRQDLFRRHGVQIVLFDRRLNFETPSGTGSSSWFATAWFTSRLCLPAQLVFTELHEPRAAEFLDVTGPSSSRLRRRSVRSVVEKGTSAERQLESPSFRLHPVNPVAPWPLALHATPAVREPR